ncbi:MAG: heme A synthase [Candidatus Krumholzibacteriota bacterium]|nr:heme A synthase [Candidatus Krumholzibacteriota bacterium]
MFLAGLTLFLVTVGASVTSTGSGLAVPDWPLSYGTLFPPMEGGIIFEHGHRMIAGVVLILTAILTIWLFRRDERAWVRNLALTGMIALVLQAVLGGLTVLFLLPAPISVSHAGLAMAFFCLTVSIALFTSPGWRTDRVEASGADFVRRCSLVTTVIIYVQILFGAVMRHTGAGLAIPDFPLIYGKLYPTVFTAPIMIHYAHRLGAAVVTVCVAWLVVRIVRDLRGEKMFTRPALLLAGMLVVQLVLGAMTIWMRRAVVPTTAHVALGAAVLAVSLVITLRARRFLPVPVARRTAMENPVPLASTGL